MEIRLISVTVSVLISRSQAMEPLGGHTTESVTVRYTNSLLWLWIWSLKKCLLTMLTDPAWHSSQGTCRCLVHAYICPPAQAHNIVNWSVHTCRADGCKVYVITLHQDTSIQSRVYVSYSTQDRTKWNQWIKQVSDSAEPKADDDDDEWINEWMNFC